MSPMTSLKRQVSWTAANRRQERKTGKKEKEKKKKRERKKGEHYDVGALPVNAQRITGCHLKAWVSCAKCPLRE